MGWVGLGGGSGQKVMMPAKHSTHPERQGPSPLLSNGVHGTGVVSRDHSIPPPSHTPPSEYPPLTDGIHSA